MSIKGVTKTEANYRAVNLDSSSSLKDFSMDRKKYLRKYILNEDVKEKETLAANMGRIVETLLMEPHLFDEKFYMSTCASVPTAGMLLFTEALYRHTLDATKEDGTISRSFEDLSRDAYVDSGYKIKYEAVMSKFIGTDAELYYNEIRIVRSKNLTVIETKDVSIAEKIVEELRTNFVTKDIVNLVDSVKYTVLDQLQVEGYKLMTGDEIVDNHLFKSMLDKVIINHDEKKIIPYDLKCTWSVENFYEEYYLHRRAYIQAYLYFNACKSLTIDPDSEYYGYTVENLKFLVCDSTNYMNPLIYTLTDKDMEEAFNGFTHKNKTYPGVLKIVTDLVWALENNIWNISKENYLLNGVINIKKKW